MIPTLCIISATIALCAATFAAGQGEWVRFAMAAALMVFTLGLGIIEQIRELKK